LDYIQQIFSRVNVQLIREFLFYGPVSEKVDKRGYKARIEEAKKQAFEILEEKFTDSQELDDVSDKVFGYSATCQDVYMEIGLQCGFALALEMLKNVGKKEV
jgi:hypothetical protein